MDKIHDIVGNILKIHGVMKLLAITGLAGSHVNGWLFRVAGDEAVVSEISHRR